MSSKEQAASSPKQSSENETANSGTKQVELAKKTDSSKVVPANKDTAAAAPAKAPRTKQQKNASFKFILGYAKRECCSVVMGLIFMFGASLVEYVTPIFIGRVVDLMREGKFDEIGEVCAYQAIVIVVSNRLETNTIG